MHTKRTRIGRVLEINIAKYAGGEMIPLSNARLYWGAGIIEDRYAKSIGTWTKSIRKAVRDVSFISVEGMLIANRGLSDQFTFDETRRNILVDVPALTLNRLVGKEFEIDTTRFLGSELCDPCQRPSMISGKRLFKEAFEGVAGLRAGVVQSGEIFRGAIIYRLS